ncbi:hypothetical protein A2U01_0072973, partial [Trifolium medium]|nr:hypothetical protein [Trifolium medium]
QQNNFKSHLVDGGGGRWWFTGNGGRLTECDDMIWSLAWE